MVVAWLCRCWAEMGSCECADNVVSEMCVCLVQDLAHDVAAVRSAAAAALAALLTSHTDLIPSTLDLVLDLYTQHLKVIVSTSQQFVSWEEIL